ncbi:hypothetical protein M405DRAFT_557925 [Rhizopogon salebrosus TDB-379]|nr:hypothetical protein M405DRAFT_557925 [Rhizopogon salebrosus TDB-379]
MKNLSKEPLRCPNRSQFGTGLTWMLSTSLNFRFQRRLRSHSFMVHSLPPLVS